MLSNPKFLTKLNAKLEQMCSSMRHANQYALFAQVEKYLAMNAIMIEGFVRLEDGVEFIADVLWAGQKSGMTDMAEPVETDYGYVIAFECEKDDEGYYHISAEIMHEDDLEEDEDDYDDDEDDEYDDEDYE